uniref:double-strand break repair helicase AddA n=1 Tax=Desertibaculum subflavum TaxID=2268458 RepID=UPI000E65EFBC
MSAPMPFEEQRLAADPASSVWVSANAGSGKTKVLVDRVMRILLAGTAPDRILALTYTRSAAAEMANRLGERLGAWATTGDAKLADELALLLGRPATAAESKRARQLFARALDSPGGLKIRTIHGFCQSLLARFPLEADIVPHFRVIEGTEQSDRLDAARDEVLAALHEDDDAAVRAVLDQLMAQVEETRFGPLIGELISGRARARLEAPLGGTIGRLRERLGLTGNETRATILAAACAELAFDAVSLRRAAKALRRGSATDRARAELLESLLGDPARRALCFETDYAGIFLTKAGEVLKRLATNGAVDADPDIVDILRTEAERMLAVKAKLAAADLAHLTGLLSGLARRLLIVYERHKRDAALLDYDDLIARTVALLERPGIAPWVLYKLDGGIDHILVDEAQDTAPEQWRIVAALAEEFFTGESARAVERTIFAVGDEKQSIYGFQGAVPAEFGRLKGLFAARAKGAGRAFEPVGLGLSFRSAPAILRVVDAVFAGEERQRAVTAGGDWLAHRAHRVGEHGRVELWPTVAPADGADEPEAWDAPLDRIAADDPRARLAGRIAAQIRGWIASGEILSSTRRPIAPEDILILVRRRNAFVDELVRRLKAAGIAVAGADRMQLLEQIAVKDLLAAIGVAILPEDDLTLAAALRSPLIGLSEHDLFELAHGRKGERLWHALVRRRGEPAFGPAHDRVALWLGAADLLPPFEFLSRILDEQGGRHALAGRLGTESWDPVDELLALALAYERTEPASLQGFHHWITAHDAEVKRDLEQGGGAVRIMTVHGAKGLEAPVVILPDTCQPPDHSNDPRVLWLNEDPPTPVWVPNKDLHTDTTLAARDAHRVRQREEYLRLLYVAMTRAQDRLYVTGYETGKGRGEGCWYDLVAATLLPMATEVELAGIGTGHRYEDGAAPEAAATDRPAALATRALPGWALSAAPPEPVP